MKKLKINYTGFWSSLDKEDCLTTSILKKYFDVEISKNPDYVFYSWYLTPDIFKYKNCIRIYYTGENVVPDFNICDYAISFEEINYGDRSFKLPLFVLYKDDLEKCMKKHLNNDDILIEKKEFCSFVYSNRNANRKRDELFYEISKYKKVNSGGRWLNNIEQITGVDNKYDFQYKHKFSIASENSSHPGYTTEKIVQAFAAKTVPIYWGDPNIKKVFNEKAFICVNDYKNIESLIERIKEIDTNEEEYLRILNEPAFVDSRYVDKLLDSYENFLLNIFNQNKEDAYRRSNDVHGKYYQEFYEAMTKKHSMIDLKLKIKRFLK